MGPGYGPSLILFLFLLHPNLSTAENFLGFSTTELCTTSPHLKLCQSATRAHSSKQINGDGLTATRLEQLSAHSKDGFIQEEAAEQNNPFEAISTRAPFHQHSPPNIHRHRHHRYKYPGRPYTRKPDPALYRIYPGLHPKDQAYCSDMKAMFAYTCAPSKPLRLDLVEFCKDYSAFCNIPNFHRLPGPRMGPPVGDKSVGHVDVNGHFGFGVGAVPGLEVGVGWGVDVGPLPGVGDSVGVGVGLDLGIMGSKSPEAFRRGQDDPNAKGGGIVGISGGVGVSPGGDSEPIGVGTGLGVGR